MDLLSETVRRDPYPTYDRLRAVAPVLPFGPAWVLLDHASVSRALRESEVFGSEVVPPTGKAPAQIMFRQTKQAVELHGVMIPRDAFVLVAVGAANRDPAAFAEPNRFDPTRDPNPHVGFGHGIHYCIGAALARLEARVVLEELFALGTPVLAGTEPWTPRKALHVLGPTALPVAFRG